MQHGRTVCEAKTTDELTTEDDHGYFGTATFEALEAVIVGGANRELFFKIVGIDNLGKGALCVHPWSGVSSEQVPV